MYLKRTIQRHPMIPIFYPVERVIKETYDTFTLELEAEDFTFAAGQFNMLYVFGVGEVPISISGRPGRLVHTIRSVGTVTCKMEALKAGDMLGVRGPFGRPWPVESAMGKDVVIVSGGIGLAPLRPVIYQILSQREHYEKVVLLYGARTPQDMLYLRELETWHDQMDVRLTVDKASGDWRGQIGFVTDLISSAQFEPENTIAMICGPEVMMYHSVLGLYRRGVENIYLSLERNMKCGIGLCGHCQFGPTITCKEGPVFRFDEIKYWLALREV